jgi:hypothetical protein
MVDEGGLSTGSICRNSFDEIIERISLFDKNSSKYATSSAGGGESEMRLESVEKRRSIDEGRPN